MSIFSSMLPLLQAVPTVAPQNASLFPGLSSLETLLLALMLIVFLAGMAAIISLSFTFMRMQRVRMLEKYHPEVLAEVGVPLPAEVSVPWWKRLAERLTDDVPVEEEDAIVLDHEYDGIHELDNNLPPWWKGLFYATIAFAPIYIWYMHFSDYGKLQHEQYAYEMEAAEDQVKAYLATQQNTIDESNVTLLTEAEALGKGQTVFNAKCSVCHGSLGEGGIGPNLTDKYWLHGGSISDVFKTIKYGVPEKGMIAWKNDLRPRDMQEVASYIISLVGTAPPNAKEPQGEEYIPVEVDPTGTEGEEPLQSK